MAKDRRALIDVDMASLALSEAVKSAVEKGALDDVGPYDELLGLDLEGYTDNVRETIQKLRNSLGV